MRGPEFLFCLIPIGFLAIAVFLAIQFGTAITGQAVLGVPLVYILVPLVSLASIGVFLAHFLHEIRDRWAWSAIPIGAFLTILFFAGLHAGSGVMCTAAICPQSEQVKASSPRLVAPLSGAAASEIDAEERKETVALDTRFSTALYFSTVTFTTLGYGDFQPVPRLRLIAAFQALVGYVFLGLLVGAAIDLMGRAPAKPKNHKRSTSWRL